VLASKESPLPPQCLRVPRENVARMAAADRCEVQGLRSLRHPRRSHSSCRFLRGCVFATVVACTRQWVSISVGVVDRKGYGRFFGALRALGGVSSRIQSVCVEERRDQTRDQTTFWIFFWKKKKGRKGERGYNECNEKTEWNEVTKVQRGIDPYFERFLTCAPNLHSCTYSPTVRSHDLTYRTTLKTL
jgi:hypothetical protein